MKRGPFLVSEERVWDPDLVPAPVAHLDLGHLPRLQRLELEARVPPRLSEVKVDGVVLHTRKGDGAEVLVHAGCAARWVRRHGRYAATAARRPLTRTQTRCAANPRTNHEVLKRCHSDPYFSDIFNKISGKSFQGLPWGI